MSRVRGLPVLLALLLWAVVWEVVGRAKLSFIVPNEEPTATVTRVQIAFPTPPDTPIPGVSVGQKPGWRSTVIA